MKRVVTVTLAVAGLAAALVAASSAAIRVPGFRTPTGNIRCLYVAGPPSTILCSISHASYAQRLQARCMGPTGAGVDWHGFSLGATRKGQILCTGGILYTGRPSYVTLPYGKSWRRGAFTCASRLAGVTCRSRSGHGIFVSRQAYRTW
jgi:hypothetical protein